MEEEEVLFSPGSMFKIVNVDTIIKNDRVIFECEMIHEGRFKETQEELEAFSANDKNLFFVFGKYLTDRGKFDEAIELYTRLQLITDDPETKYAYEFQSTAITMRREHIQTTGSDWSLASILPPGQFRDLVEQMPSLPSLTTAAADQDVTNYFRSGNQYSMLGKFSEFSFTYVPQLMREQQWDLAILLLQTILNTILPTIEFSRRFLNQPCDVYPLLKQKCHLYLGRCYFEKKNYDQAMVNFESALSGNTQLPTPDYIHASSGIAYLLYINGDHLQSLYRYIEISEFVNQDPTLKDSGVDIKIQGYIEIVLSKIIDMD